MLTWFYKTHLAVALNLDANDWQWPGFPTIDIDPTVKRLQDAPVGSIVPTNAET